MVKTKQLKRPDKEARDKMVDDATHRLNTVFAQGGVYMTDEDLYRLNDLLSDFLTSVSNIKK